MPRPRGATPVGPTIVSYSAVVAPSDVVRSAPLDGIRVLDFTRVLSGPIVGRLLADLGADVIKIEPPVGDLTRYAYPRIGSTSLYFAQQNCGKRNVSIDLARPDGAALARRLCRNADVILENYRPGVMARHGIGYDDVAPANPGVVYASISGYGQVGAWADRRAYAVVVHAEAGLIDAGSRMRSDAAGMASPSVQDGMSHADVYAGLMACNAVLAALFARARHGAGDHIDVAMADAMLFVQDFAHWDYAPPEAHDPAHWPTLAPAYSPIVATADGAHVVIAGDPTGRGVFEHYVAAMDRPDLAHDPRFTDPSRRREHRDALLDIVATWCATQSCNELFARLSRAGLASGQVRTVSELLDTAWARERGVLVAASTTLGESVPVVQAPWRFARGDVEARPVVAYRGEHNADVLQEVLGISTSALHELEASGAISSRAPRQRR